MLYQSRLERRSRCEKNDSSVNCSLVFVIAVLIAYKNTSQEMPNDRR